MNPYKFFSEEKFMLVLTLSWRRPIICSKLTIETLEQGVKYVQS